MSEYLSVTGVGGSRTAALEMADSVAVDWFGLDPSQVGRLDRTIGCAAPREMMLNKPGDFFIRVLSWEVEVQYRWLP